jgi:hypothetical protein
LGGPTSSYATAGIALWVIGTHKPHHHDKVEAPSVGMIIFTFIFRKKIGWKLRQIWKLHRIISIFCWSPVAPSKTIMTSLLKNVPFTWSVNPSVVNNYHTTSRNTPEDHRLHQHRSWSLKSRFVSSVWKCLLSWNNGVGGTPEVYPLRNEE